MWRQGPRAPRHVASGGFRRTCPSPAQIRSFVGGGLWNFPEQSIGRRRIIHDNVPSNPMIYRLFAGNRLFTANLSNLGRTVLKQDTVSTLFDHFESESTD